MAHINTITACDHDVTAPAFISTPAFTSQNNSPFLNIRQQYHPLLDASVFKQFAIREGVNFEIRGEFFNIFNTPIWGGPSTTLGACKCHGSSASSGSTAAPKPNVFSPRPTIRVSGNSRRVSTSEICTVRINGKDAGTLWAMPYQLDITDSLTDGRNLSNST